MGKVFISNSQRLLNSFNEWKALTTDKWVLATVSGYKIDFDSPPKQEKLPNKICFSEEEIKIIDLEILNMQNEGVIELSVPEKGQFISNIFIVPKPNGKFRPVINLRELNKFVHYEHFKMETFPFVLELVQKNDFFTSLDLKSAYFSIPIHPSCQKFLKFCWKERLFHFVSLPFGLASAPRIFTKVLKPVYAFFRQIGIRCSYYIDDSLNMHAEKKTCEMNALLMYEKLQALGFVINDEKSVVIATQRITFFGYILDSVLFMVFLPEKKVLKILDLAAKLLLKQKCSIRELASFIGLLINAFHAILEAPMHYRVLEHLKVESLRLYGTYDGCVVLTEMAKNEIQWWIDNTVRKNGKKIRQAPISYWIQTDSSMDGWGCFCENSKQCIGGRWSQKERSYHINYLELLAIYFALRSWFSDKKDLHIGVKSDNITAIVYVNNMGGMTSNDLDCLSREIWEWCLKRQIFVTAFHLPGQDNVTADYFSRNFSDSTEWMLKKDIFQRLTKQLFIPDIDLFASRLNAQLECYVSWFPDPEADYVDAFSLNWAQFKPYIFPPFKLMGKILNKIIDDKVPVALVVCPFWTKQPWFPLLLQCLISIPIRLPRHRDLVLLPHNQQHHPMGKNLSLIGVLVSGITSKVEDFQRKLLQQSSIAGDQAHKNNTSQLGNIGLIGASLKTLIDLKHLKSK